jgi:hypothetical protein
LSVTLTSWYTNDSESPDRYRAVRLYIHAFGNANPFDHRGSRMWVSNVGVIVISAEATNYDRNRAGCDMPSHD